eukprot:1133739-Pelagomonas_calceolata.AAC.5
MLRLRSESTSPSVYRWLIRTSPQGQRTPALSSDLNSRTQALSSTGACMPVGFRHAASVSP